MVKNVKKSVSATKKEAPVATAELVEEKEVSQAQLDSICYKSKLLNRYFDSYDELVAAETEYNEAHAKELAIKEARAADLVKVQDAANTYLEVLRKNDEARKALKESEQDAYLAYKEQLNDFAEVHNGYHLTYKRNGDNIEFKIEENHQDELEKYLEEQRETFKKIWNSFWS